jgi:3-hydroxyisobutyrate dehydrogenase-like beta-hydroxyacid dehydrogenase
MMKIGILHPGEMGVSIAVSAQNDGHQVHWVSKGRSQKTKRRASQHGLIDSISLENLCHTCDVILSVCPPHIAEDVANQIMDQGFHGLYLDANAISPQRARRIGEKMESTGIQFVDGGIIGGPAWEPNGTCLYLSGKNADQIAGIFSAGPLETKVIDMEIGKASALKMCYAAYSKGTTALLCAVLGTAESLGIRNELYQQWDLDDSGFSEQVNRRVAGVTTKAWRFEGEMREIAATFHEAGMPRGFHDAAADIYNRISGITNTGQVPELKDVLQALLTK